MKAGAVYFAVVFTVAFGLGMVRVLFVVPRLGPMLAVLLEAPALLLVSLAACRCA